MTPKSTDNRPVAIFPGSFNPFTKGHLSILERALPLFSKVYVAIGYNAEKEQSDNMSERIEIIRKAVNKYPTVDVISYSGLTVHEARRLGAKFILRGVRDVADFENESRLADVNRRLSGIETLLLLSLPEYSSFSSSVVRELESYGEDVSPFIP